MGLSFRINPSRRLFASFVAFIAVSTTKRRQSTVHRSQECSLWHYSKSATLFICVVLFIAGTLHPYGKKTDYFLRFESCCFGIFFIFYFCLLRVAWLQSICQKKDWFNPSTKMNKKMWVFFLRKIDSPLRFGKSQFYVEFTSQKKGTTHESSCVSTPTTNKMRLLREKMGTCLIKLKLYYFKIRFSKKLRKAVLAASYLINHLPSSVLIPNGHLC